MSLIKANGAGDQDTGFYNGAVTNSVRLNGSDTHFRRTLSEGGDRRQATYSFWLKHGDDGNTNYNPIIFSKGNNVAYSDSIYLQIRTTSQGGDIYMTGYLDDSQQALIVTNRKFRDPSAWYHFVLAFDTEQSTNTDRMKLYVNGVQETSFSSVVYPSQNADMAFGYYGSNSGDDEVIGDYDAGESSTYHINGCLAEFHYVDGQQLTPTSFGEFKNGVWIPIKYTGSHGTIGYHLKFDQTGTGTASSSTIGADSSGNNNHFTSSGIAAHDCNFPDSPENNFCTLHPQGRRYGQSYMATFSEGNLKAVGGGNATHIWGTMAINQIASQGGVYFEVRLDSTDGNRSYGGLVGDNGVNNKSSSSNGATYQYPIKALIDLMSSVRGHFGTDTDGTSIDLTSGNTGFSNGDIAGFAILSDGKFFCHRNGTYIKNASGNTGNPSTGANPIATIDLTEGDWIPYVGYNSSYSVNFGQDGTFAGQETSGGNQDANGIGDFMHAVPTNCLAICSSNMAEPTIGPNSDTQADDHFNTVIYTGTGNNTQDVTNIGFQPDWVWIKNRTDGYSHQLQDSSRGMIATKILSANQTEGENTASATGDNYGHISDTGTANGGFFTVTHTINANNDGGTIRKGTHFLGNNYVSWNWKANSGVTSTNNDGSLQSTVQANTTAGFSIVTYTGDSTGNNGTASTVGHGLNAVPKFIWTLPRDSNDGAVYHAENTSAPETDRLILKSDSSNNTGTSDDSGFWNDTAPTSSVFSIGTRKHTNSNGGMVAYCFAEIEGYSKFGSYIAISGSGSTPNHDGVFIYLGFRPAWIAIKRADGTGNWNIHDKIRSPNNPMQNFMLGTAVAEQTSEAIEFISNGVKLRSASGYFDHPSGANFVYLAFAETPFKYSNAR